MDRGALSEALAGDQVELGDPGREALILPLEGLAQEIRVDVKAQPAVLHHAHLEDLEERVDDEEEETGRDHRDGRGQHRFPQDLLQVTHEGAHSDQRLAFSFVNPQSSCSPRSPHGVIADG